MRLQERLDAFKKSFEAKVPKDVVDTMHRATDDPRNSEILERTVKAGDKAPVFSLGNTNGQRVTLTQLISKGLVVLSFYRGRW